MGANDTVYNRSLDGGMSSGPGQVFTPWSEWSEAGKYAFTAAGTTPAVGARDIASVVDSTSVQVIEVPFNANAIIMRFTGATADAINVYDVLAARKGTDHYTRIGTLTVTTGTQVSSVASQEFADQIAISNERWPATWKFASAADDYIGEAEVDFRGYSQMALVCTTNGNDGTVDIAGY
jgi:hypothetical protein